MSNELQQMLARKHQREREATRKLMIYFDLIARQRLEKKNKKEDDNRSSIP